METSRLTAKLLELRCFLFVCSNPVRAKGLGETMRRIVAILSLVFCVLPQEVYSQCNAPHESKIIGTATNSNTTYGPVDNNYKYGYHQIIYDATELCGQGAPCTIYGIAFQYGGSNNMTAKTDVSIYIGEVGRDRFANTTNWEPSSNLTEVYHGSLNCAGNSGWNWFTFSHSYNFSGAGYLVVAVLDNSNGSNGNNAGRYGFHYSACTGQKHLYIRNNNAIDIDAPGTGTRASNRPNTQFCVDCGEPCTELAVPVCFDFEDYSGASSAYEDGGLPSCWSRIYNGTEAGYAPHVYNGGYADVCGGDNALVMVAGGEAGTNNIVHFPAISGIASGTRISFTVDWESSDYCTLQLGRVSGTTFTNLYTVTPTDGCATYTYTFTAALPAGASLAFRIRSTDDTWYSVSIDNICLLAPCNTTFRMNQINGSVREIDCGHSYCFYDGGGDNGNYSSDESYTATFTSNGVISMSFTGFDTEDGWDMMSVYDGDNSGTLILDSWGGQTVPGTLTATSGMMTVVWSSDGSNEYSGWNAVITASDCCDPMPGELAFAELSHNTTAGDTYANTISVNTTGHPASDITYSISPTVAGVTINTATGLVTTAPGLDGTFTVTATIASDVYCDKKATYALNVGVVCDETIILNSNLARTIECGRTYCFYDRGDASGQYSDNEDYTATFTSTGSIMLSFAQFSTEENYDRMTVYDGDESGTVLHSAISGSYIPPIVTANSGTMTVVWSSDVSNTGIGWKAYVTATDCCVNILKIDEINGNPKSVNCDNTYCFFDSGGESGSYGENEDFTAQFFSIGDITLSFLMFNTEDGYDMISVYDGGLDGTPLLNSYGGSDLPPDVTATSGTMTVRWVSDGSITYPGWKAKITVTECCTKRTGIAGFAFCKSEMSIANGSTFSLPVEGADGVTPAGTVTYESSNPAVATIDPLTGIVTAVGNGTTTITASIPAANISGVDYCAATASYVLHVGVAEVCNTVVDGTSTNNDYAPIYGLWRHSWVQMIYDKNYFSNCDCSITAVTFFSDAANPVQRTTSLYVATTTKTQFNSTTDFVSQNGSVFSGTWLVAAGENTFVFDTPIPYNCSQNLLIGMLCAASDYESTSFDYLETTGSYTSIIAYSDDYVPNPANMSNYAGYTDRYERLPKLKVCFECAADPTPLPSVTLTGIPASPVCSGVEISPITVSAVGGTVSFDASLPAGLDYNDVAHPNQIFGSPTNAATYNFNVVVTDPDNCLKDEKPVTISVIDCCVIDVDIQFAEP